MMNYTIQCGIYEKRRTQANRLWGRRGGGRGAIDLGVGEPRTVGSNGAADRLSEHLICSGVIPGGPEVQGLGEGPPGELTSGATE